MGHKPHRFSVTEQADALEQVKRIRGRLDAVDDMLAEVVVEAQAIA